MGERDKVDPFSSTGKVDRKRKREMKSHDKKPHQQQQLHIVPSVGRGDDGLGLLDPERLMLKSKSMERLVDVPSMEDLNLPGDISGLFDA